MPAMRYSAGNGRQATSLAGLNQTGKPSLKHHAIDEGSCVFTKFGLLCSRRNTYRIFIWLEHTKIADWPR